ncbi:Centrosomal protein [Heracleum sosnowskyi]|uniref:Centrosomal protein n=1 Tax=Heracleum sosnowskyi TaxID=360622 RepID=A0AAD8IN63_9APIA|nr:Centrosomal protein [Heracleum sosnowskyi]
MEAVYKTSKNATFSSGFHGHGMNNNLNELYTSPFNLSYSSSLSCASPQQNQAPLLPLPNSRPHQNNRRKYNNITNQQPLSVRKSSVSTGGREKFKHPSVSSNSMNNRLGPDPMDVPKFLFSSRTGARKIDQVAKFSGTVVSTVLSPPPSSLPLPTFWLRPKLSCNGEIGIDAGATDSLRRILRIR